MRVTLEARFCRDYGRFSSRLCTEDAVQGFVGLSDFNFGGLNMLDC